MYENESERLESYVDPFLNCPSLSNTGNTPTPTSSCSRPLSFQMSACSDELEHGNRLVTPDLSPILEVGVGTSTSGGVIKQIFRSRTLHHPRWGELNWWERLPKTMAWAEPEPDGLPCDSLSIGNRCQWFSLIEAEPPNAQCPMPISKQQLPAASVTWN